jgi:hypothetical protein
LVVADAGGGEQEVTANTEGFLFGEIEKF